MNDADHLHRFEDQSLPLEEWNHRAHLKTAYLYLNQFSFAEALERLRRGIQAYNTAHGIENTSTSGYHETMTQVWLQLVHTTLRQFGPADTADAFFDAQTQLCDKRTPLLFYSRGLLMSAEAKRSFVAPDLTTLPQLPFIASPTAARTPLIASPPKPPSVTTAIRLLWLSLALAIPRIWIDWPIIKSARRLEIAALTFVFVLGILAWLINMIDEGYHWARVTFLVLLVVSLPFALIGLIECFGYSATSGMLNLVQGVLQLAGIALLFTASARPWFHQSTAPNEG